MDGGGLGSDAFIVKNESLGGDMVEEDMKWGKKGNKGGNIMLGLLTIYS